MPETFEELPSDVPTAKSAGMFVVHNPSRIKRIQIWFRKHWDWTVLSTQVFGVGGVVASVWGSAQQMFPWHFSVVLIVLVGFQSYYCSRYYRLKHQRSSPRKGYRALHEFAEALRENASEDYSLYLKQAQEGNLAVEAIRKLVANHCMLAHLACKNSQEVLRQHGLKIERVCIKLLVGNQLMTIADQKEPKCQAQKKAAVEESIFWRLLWNIHFNYEEWKARDALRCVLGNHALHDKPRFLAIGTFERKNPPDAFVTVAEVLEDKGTLPTDHRKRAESFWAKLRDCVAGRYDNCIGIMICGLPEFSDPLTDPPKSESTRLSIGFVGFDSKDPDVPLFLDQDDIEGVAAIADALYPPLRNLKIFLQRGLELGES